MYFIVIYRICLLLKKRNFSMRKSYERNRYWFEMFPTICFSNLEKLKSKCLSDCWMVTLKNWRYNDLKKRYTIKSNMIMTLSDMFSFSFLFSFIFLLRYLTFARYMYSFLQNDIKNWETGMLSACRYYYGFMGMASTMI